MHTTLELYVLNAKLNSTADRIWIVNSTGDISVPPNAIFVPYSY